MVWIHVHVHVLAHLYMPNQVYVPLKYNLVTHIYMTTYVYVQAITRRTVKIYYQYTYMYKTFNALKLQQCHYIYRNRPAQERKNDSNLTSKST